MSDEIRRLTDELARDPASLAFVALGEALRRQGELENALKITLRGLERHPYNVDGHDLLARISLDRGEAQRAMDEWGMVLRLLPGHVGAHKGLGFVAFQDGRLEEAEAHLGHALEHAPGDAAIAGALAHVRTLRPASSNGGEPSTPTSGLPIIATGNTPATGTPVVRDQRMSTEVPAPPPEAAHDPRYLFADLLYHGDQTALLLDAEGLVLAGVYVAHDGQDVSQEIGAALSGVSDEAVRATRHLDIGEWSSIVFQTEIAAVSMSPSRDGGIVMVATGQSTPLGLAKRLLDRCVTRARQWLEALA